MSKHVQGTEVKAITYSNMQICTDLADVAPSTDGEANSDMVRPQRIPGRHEVWVIIDI